jgi:hypothetical protein
MADRNISFYLRRLRRQQRLVHAIILHFDPIARDLRAWFWYVDTVCDIGIALKECVLRPVTEEGMRVTPMDLPDHQITHEFRAPCCLCACNFVGTRYIESAIYLANDGPYIGEYVAGCASDTCGYIGKPVFELPKFGRLLTAFLPHIVCIERLYTKMGLYLQRYPMRSKHISRCCIYYKYSLRPGLLAEASVHLPVSNCLPKRGGSPAISSLAKRPNRELHPLYSIPVT